MVKTRLTLHTELCALLGSEYVYFQPPETIKLHYPCIMYDHANKNTSFADNKPYLFFEAYSLVYITKDPDDSLVKTIATSFERCSYGRHYVSDGLHHFTFTLFY